MAPKGTKYVAYYRVSTQKQGKSGLGLEAQKASVNAFVPDGSLIAELIEVESGKKASRPKLDEACSLCRLKGAVLVVAKLDRLARNAFFLMKLKNAGIRFIACDMPEANEFIVGIMAQVAELEAKMISDRTKAALQAARQRGVKLGNPQNLVPGGSAKTARNARTKLVEKADIRARDVATHVKQAKADGCTSLRSIADRLNGIGIPSPRGGIWYPTSVKNAIERLSA